MAATPVSLKHQMQKIAGRWAEDPFRPNVQLKIFLTSLADHPSLTPAAVRAARALENDEFKKEVSACSCLTRSTPQGTLFVDMGDSGGFGDRLQGSGGNLGRNGARGNSCALYTACCTVCLRFHASSKSGLDS